MLAAQASGTVFQSTRFKIAQADGNLYDISYALFYGHGRLLSLGSTNKAITIRFLKVCYDEIRQFPDLFVESGSSNRPTVFGVDGRPSPAQEPRKAGVAAAAAAEPENDSPDQCPASSGKRVFVSAAANVGDDEREATLTTARAVKSRTKRVSSMATDLLSRLQAGSVPILHCNVHAVWLCRCLC